MKSFVHTTHANFKLGVQYPLSYISMLKSYHFNFKKVKTGCEDLISGPKRGGGGTQNKIPSWDVPPPPGYSQKSHMLRHTGIIAQMG